MELVGGFEVVGVEDRAGGRCCGRGGGRGGRGERGRRVVVDGRHYGLMMVMYGRTVVDREE